LPGYGPLWLKRSVLLSSARVLRPRLILSFFFRSYSESKCFCPGWLRLGLAVAYRLLLIMDICGIAGLLHVIEKTFPVPGRFRARLPGDVADLSRLLTSARGERDSGYLSRPSLLSAYLRYFLPWNVFRLCRLFSFDVPGQSLFPPLSDGDAVTDIGSGPLVFPIALWMAFPGLRHVKLEFRCVDKSAAALDAGHKLFKALCDAAHCGGAWKIRIIHDSMDRPIRGSPAKLVTAVNVFNEVSTETNRAGSFAHDVKKAASLLTRLCGSNGSILVVEPGNPQGGAFIAALRAALLERGRLPAAPCTHSGACPLPGGPLPGARNAKAKWCHFAFDTKTAPQALHGLSAAAGIPKERATLSFLLAGPAGEAGARQTRRMEESACAKRTGGKAAATHLPRIRIISDAFPVSGGSGCYGCSEKGMVLVTGHRARIGRAIPGTLLELPFPAFEQRDQKTGALIVPLSSPERGCRARRSDSHSTEQGGRASAYKL